jgi:hypothetical protein
VNVSIFNRIILDNISIKDQKKKELLTAPRISVSLNIIDLLKGKISISSAQIFGMKANLYKETEVSKTNFQFILDSLSSKENTKKKPLDLKVGSLIIRRSEIAYNELYSPDTGILSPKHINLRNISAHIILNKLTNDSINANIKKIAFNDKNGLVLKKLSFRLVGGNGGALVSNIRLQLPHSDILIPKVTVNYVYKNNRLETNTLSYNFSINKSNVTLCDLSTFNKILRNYTTPIFISANIEGTDSKIQLKNVDFKQTTDLELYGDATFTRIEKQWKWESNIEKFNTDAAGLRSFSANLDKQDLIPIMVDNLGTITLKCKASGYKDNIDINGQIKTDIGVADITINKVGDVFKSNIIGKSINAAALADNNDLGYFNGKIFLSGQLKKGKLATLNANSNIEEFTFKNHNYHNADIKVNYVYGGLTQLAANLNDNAGTVNLNGTYDMSSSRAKADFRLNAKGVNPMALGITDKWKNNIFDFTLTGNIHGGNINDSEGNIVISNFVMRSEEGEFKMNSLEIQKDKDASGSQHIVLKSDFGNINAYGKFNYNTIYNSLIAAIHHRLPTMPGLPKFKKEQNEINIYATINQTEWAEKLLGIPLSLQEDAHLIANIDDKSGKVNINVDIPKFAYNKQKYKDGYLIVSSPNDTLKAKINVTSISNRGDTSHYMLTSKAIDNHLVSQLNFNIHGNNSINGQINTDAKFYKNAGGMATAHVNILKSDILVDDTTWTVNPSNVEYCKNRLLIDNFSVKHNDQEIRINGLAEKDINDEISLYLKDVNVAYILDLVNFHSVDFGGYATGNASFHGLFGKPKAETNLYIKDFIFENGTLGNLEAHATWNNDDGAINIDAVSTEGNDYQTVIKGYVSPKRKNIDLNINAYGSNLNFIRSYCDSFASDINLRGWGNLSVVGPLSAIQLIGDAKVSGNAHIISLNTTYNLDNARVKFNPDDIIFYNDTIRDRNGNIGVVNGHLRHNHISNFTYDLEIAAYNLLAYDTHDFGEEVFYGTAYATGKCNIKGKSGEVVIDIEATPEKNSQIVYNAASPDAIANSEFIHWNDRDLKQEENTNIDKNDRKQKIQLELGTNLYLNLLVHCNPNATVKVLMDQQSDDYISLTGNGTIRTSYYNKGNFEMFGNYVVDQGVYKLTVQNVIKRDFSFLSGGSISFGGDAYNALLNLQAQYTLNSVPLSDLRLGSSFTNNNIRVDCIMNITGTPMQPHVDFSLDMPTVSSDAKQMVMSVMNSNEEINQQVIYLLAVGRFLNQDNNGAPGESQRQSQTSLAMQSILSGTISQQLSTVLENTIGNNQWNLGANISTGDEGFNNAEYEGLVSGHLLDNRLLINGQFGYRDNPNATSTFIGDFDIRYLLVPSGSAAIRVYNQTNDKYFTKNSLNTQGVGLILKRDFNGWRDFFRWGKKKKK